MFFDGCARCAVFYSVFKVHGPWGLGQALGQAWVSSWPGWAGLSSAGGWAELGGLDWAGGWAELRAGLGCVLGWGLGWAGSWAGLRLGWAGGWPGPRANRAPSLPRA